MIPAAKLAIQKLIQYNIPFVFVSNTCMFESEKADQLSKLLEVPVCFQYITSLKLFKRVVDIFR